MQVLETRSYWSIIGEKSQRFVSHPFFTSDIIKYNANHRHIGLHSMDKTESMRIRYEEKKEI